MTSYPPSELAASAERRCFRPAAAQALQVRAVTLQLSRADQTEYTEKCLSSFRSIGWLAIVDQR